MTNITCLDDIKNSLQDRGFVILYFSSNSCNVCLNIFPKVKEMLKTYPTLYHYVFRGKRVNASS